MFKIFLDTVAAVIILYLVVVYGWLICACITSPSCQADTGYDRSIIEIFFISFSLAMLVASVIFYLLVHPHIFSDNVWVNFIFRAVFLGIILVFVLFVGCGAFLFLSV